MDSHGATRASSEGFDADPNPGFTGPPLCESRVPAACPEPAGGLSAADVARLLRETRRRAEALE
ncbi:MAG: hypothetical protein JXP34_06645 [Planctomycetes bacterium]|nr:hypothetical protein [Planctomycetota bacterium]